MLRHCVVNLTSKFHDEINKHQFVAKMKVLEFFSGIGGMHFALKECEFNSEVLLAADINPVANEIYKHNFPDVTLLNRNIQSLSPNFLRKLGADTILMSPPCQPFTRNGLKGDINDPRSQAFIHIMNILPHLNVTRILIENVKGFETSHMRNLLIQTLDSCGFSYQEFLLSPMQIGIPNSRLRYYCLAKKAPHRFEFDTSPLMYNFPDQLSSSMKFRIKDILEPGDKENYCLPMKLLKKYWKVLDICFEDSQRSCCFTKAYGRYSEGTGSVFSDLTENECVKILEELENLSFDSIRQEELLKSLKLRYFTPLEVSRLQCFPVSFKFPENITDRQKYMVLGNSINVEVVSKLIKLLH